MNINLRAEHVFKSIISHEDLFLIQRQKQKWSQTKKKLGWLRLERLRRIATEELEKN